MVLQEKEDNDKLKNVLDVCGLLDFIKFLDNDIESIFRSNQVFLSGGYQQRRAIAGAIYKTELIKWKNKLL